MLEEERNERNSIKHDLQELSVREEINCKRKSHFKWLQQGDGNTKFLHRYANGRKKEPVVKEKHRKYIKKMEFSGWYFG